MTFEVEPFHILIRILLHLMCEYIFYTFISPKKSRDLRVIYDVTRNANLSD